MGAAVTAKRVAVDTSVAVPALVPTHEAHTVTRPVLAERPAIPAHVMLECYSVLTRLPIPMRVPPAVAADVLMRTFPVVLTLDDAAQRHLVNLLAAVGVSGGGAYDGLVGLTAHHAGLQLCTRDRRARATYEALGIEVRWVG